MKPIPCINCITLAICQNVFLKEAIIIPSLPSIGVTRLTHKCSILSHYIFSGKIEYEICRVIENKVTSFFLKQTGTSNENNKE